MKIICPLCNKIVEYDHILMHHKDFWKSKGIFNMPNEVESFNKRFAMIGLNVIEVDSDSSKDT